MRFWRTLFHFYIDASMHVALAIMCLVYVTDFTNSICKSIVYPTGVFFGTIVAYNFLKYFELIALKRVFNAKTITIIIFTLFSLLLFLGLFWWMKTSIKIQIAIAGLLVLVYPFLRKYGWLKMFLVSGVITIVSVYIPFYLKKPILLDYYITLIQRFLFVTSLMMPFEIYDSQFDGKQLNTFPQRFGIRKSKLFGMLLIIPFIVIEFLKEKTFLTTIPIGIITVLAIHFTELKRNRYYTSFWVESIPIVWLVLLLIFA